MLKPSGRLVTVAASGERTADERIRASKQSEVMKRRLCCQRKCGYDTDFSDDGKRFVVRADERLTAFLALELAIRIRHDRT